MHIVYWLDGRYYDHMVEHMPYHFIQSQRSLCDFDLSYLAGGEL